MRPILPVLESTTMHIHRKPYRSQRCNRIPNNPEIAQLYKFTQLHLWSQSSAQHQGLWRRFAHDNSASFTGSHCILLFEISRTLKFVSPPIEGGAVRSLFPSNLMEVSPTRPSMPAVFCTGPNAIASRTKVETNPEWNKLKTRTQQRMDRCCSV